MCELNWVLSGTPTLTDIPAIVARLAKLAFGALWTLSDDGFIMSSLGGSCSGQDMKPDLDPDDLSEFWLTSSLTPPVLFLRSIPDCCSGQGINSEDPDDLSDLRLTSSLTSLVLFLRLLIGAASIVDEGI